MTPKDIDVIKDGTSDQVAAVIYQRRGEAVCVRKVQVCLGDWTPEASYCHANVARWIAEKTTHKVVRGWLIVDISGGEGWAFYFNAHSIVERDDGMLMDITPYEPHHKFLRHTGTDASFDRFKEKEMSRLQYPLSHTSLRPIGLRL